MNKSDLTRYEQETIINYNNSEKTASCYTMDSSLIRKLDKLCEVSKEINVVKTGDGCKTYTFPKKWVKVRKPRELTDEQREKAAKKAREAFGYTKET